MANRVPWTLAGAVVVIAAIVVAVVWVVILRGDVGPAVATSRITVEEITNRVETERPRERSEPAAVFAPAQIGQHLLPGDGVKTFLESEARVDIRVQEFLRITRTTPDTIWRLGQFGLDQDTIIELGHGKIFLFDEGFQPDSRPLRIVTPSGTASPRGTWMSVQHDKDTRETEVKCFRGSCELENDFGKQVMNDEEKSTSTGNKEPTKPVFLDDEEKEAFLKLPEVNRDEIHVPTPVVIPPTLTPSPDPTPTERPPDTPVPEPADTPEPIRQPDIVPTAAPEVIPTNTPPPPPTDTPMPTATPTSVPPTAAPTPSTGPRVSENLAPNPSFERGASALSGWSSEAKGTDAILEWEERIARRGNRSLKVTASRSANQGWPGWETVAAIPIEPGVVYEFSVWAYIEDKAIFWMDIDILDSAGRRLIGTSTGNILLDQAGEWLQMTKALDTNHYKESYPDMAAVKLGLRLSLLYEHFGIPEGTATSIYYDDVTFSAP